MKINSKIGLTVLLAGVFALGQGSLFAKSNEQKGKEAGKAVDQAVAATKEKAQEVADATKEKAKEAKKKADELAEKTKEKASELHDAAKEKAHKAIDKA